MTMDRALKHKMFKNGSLKRMKQCSKGHYNSLNAKFCWRCGQGFINVQ